MKKNTRKYIEKKKKEGLYGVDWNKIKLKAKLPKTWGAMKGESYKPIYTSGFFRQIFREMPEDKIFTAKQLGDFFERYAPFDPKGLIAKAFKKEFKEELKKKI